MQHQQRNGVQWLSFEPLIPFSNLSHATFLRHGGVSKAPFFSLNFAYDIGDHPECVEKNISIALNAIHLTKPEPKIWFANQVHGTTLVELSNEMPEEIFDCDGFYTDQKRIGIMIKHADCQAAILYDPKHHAVCVIHAGWRGLVKGIYEKAIKTMQERYQSALDQIIVCVSPSLGPEYAEFIDYKTLFPKEFWPFQTRENYFNLWDITYHKLIKQGILPKNIEIAHLCTYKERHHYFSYRREKTTGRHATFVMLK